MSTPFLHLYAPISATLTPSQRRSLAAQARNEIAVIKANIASAHCQLWRAVQESQLAALTHRLGELTAAARPRRTPPRARRLSR